MIRETRAASVVLVWSRRFGARKVFIDRGVAVVIFSVLDIEMKKIKFENQTKHIEYRQQDKKNLMYEKHTNVNMS